MVFNSGMLIRVVDASADACQYTARIQEQDRLGTHQLLDLICCLPLEHLGRLILCIWTYLCASPPDSYFFYSSYSDSDEDAGHGGGFSATVHYVDVDFDSSSE
ncbi:hypothetical protein SAY86_018236 [Trapa natans]|uniref:Uncharacterized protein n=1 Tax=Trapa natans TaxID=22666 RepID=A0AAN7L9T4_TRANT|nr:hypothetical protein SAY86_018236 [Trapa natans]